MYSFFSIQYLYVLVTYATFFLFFFLNGSVPKKCLFPFNLSENRILHTFFDVSISSVYEEFVWRGIQKSLFNQNLFLIVVNSIIFSLSHIYTRNRKAHFADIMDVYLLALFLSFVYFFTNDLFLCVLIHAVRNFLLTLLRNTYSKENNENEEKG